MNHTFTPHLNAALPGLESTQDLSVSCRGGTGQRLTGPNAVDLGMDE